MIFYAENRDLKEIIDLFNICFEGEEQFTKLFFDNFYKMKDTIVCKIDEKIVAMVQMIPYEVNGGYATYIYGACTHPDYRKQGIMEKLLAKSFEISKQRGHDYSFLIPGEPWLFDFYKKYGYESNLEISVGEYQSKEFYKNEITCVASAKDDCDKLVDIYNQNICGEFFIKRKKQDFLNQLKMFELMLFFKNNQVIGYAFYYKADNGYVLEEIMTSDLQHSLQSACEMLKSDKIVYKTVGNSKKIGCIKSLSSKNPPFGYINLMFN